MIAGVGVDLLGAGQIPDAVLRPGDPFLMRIYTPAERRCADAAPDRGAFLRGRFAGKEAVFKALGVHGDHARLSEIEILPDENGAPRVRLSGKLLAAAESKGIGTVWLSLSNDVDHFIAFAVAEIRETEGSL